MKSTVGHLWREILVVFLIAFAVFSYLQYSDIFRDNDAFYHLKMSLLVKQQLLVRDFPWLQMTGLQSYFTDQHYLYHLLVVPFLFLGLAPIVAFKLSTVFFAAMLVVSLFLLLKSQSIKGSLFWALYILVSGPLIFRLSLGKANSLSMIFMLGVVYALFSNKRLFLYILSFFYVWLHGSWPVLLILSGLFVFSEALSQLDFKKKIFLKLKTLQPLFIVIAGIISGIIINPYFPKNIEFFRSQIFEVAVKGYYSLISIGNEWRPMDLWTFIFGNYTLSLLTIVATIVVIKNWRKVTTHLRFLFFVTIFFSFYALHQIRMNEYFVIFAVLFCAFTGEFIRTTSFSDIVREYVRNFYKYEGVKAVCFSIFSALVLFIALGSDIVETRGKLLNGVPVHRFTDVGIWLSSNTEKGSTIFHTQWDSFPSLFLSDDHNTFLIGLDPVFAYLENKDKYNSWLALSEARVSKTHFVAKFTQTFPEISYILLEKSYNDRTVFRNFDGRLNEFLKTSTVFEKVYEDNESLVYEKQP